MKINKNSIIGVLLIFILGSFVISPGTRTFKWITKVGQDSMYLDTAANLYITGQFSYNKTMLQITDTNGAISREITLADTFYTLASDSILGMKESRNNFTFNSTTGKAYYTGPDSAKVLFLGNANISINDLDNRVTFALFKNDTLYTNVITPADFTSLDKLQDIGINYILCLNNGDSLDVRAKCNEAGHTLTLESYNLTFWGE